MTEDLVPQDVLKKVNAAQAEADRLAGLLAVRLGDIVPDPALKFGRGFREELSEGPARERGKITRAELLAMGAELTPESSGEDLTRFLWAVNAWGYGTSGYGLTRTRAVIADPGRFSSSARVALGLLHDESRDGGAVEAYYWLHNQTGHVKRWGPAFFTKFLAFADPANRQPVWERDPAQILDSRMATALNDLLENNRGEETNLGRYRKGGWTTPQYAFYIRLMRAAGRDVGAPEGLSGAMTAERVIFFGGTIATAESRSDSA